MFGDLFTLEDEEEAPVTVGNDRNVVIHSSQKSKKVLQAPPSVRGPTKLCGLINQGATCYLNSLIQSLFFTPEFRGKAMHTIQFTAICHNKHILRKLTYIIKLILFV